MLWIQDVPFAKAFNHWVKSEDFFSPKPKLDWQVSTSLFWVSSYAALTNNLLVWRQKTFTTKCWSSGALYSLYFNYWPSGPNKERLETCGCFIYTHRYRLCSKWLTQSEMTAEGPWTQTAPLQAKLSSAGPPEDTLLIEAQCLCPVSRGILFSPLNWDFKHSCLGHSGVSTGRRVAHAQQEPVPPSIWDLCSSSNNWS